MLRISGHNNAIRTALIYQSVAVNAAWFAVVDAAQDSTLPQRAGKVGLRTQSLYAGRLGGMLEDVAPHLVTVDLHSGFARWFARHWGGNHGILLQSRASFEELRKHFRHFLMVKDEAGKKYRFRFYDPRILRAFLPACTPDEVRQFFGPIERFYTLTRDGSGVLAFSRSDRGVRVVELTGRLTAQAVANRG
jgi:hypothetical protein